MGEHWRPTTRKEFGPYVRCLADKMELRDWTVCVRDDAPASSEHVASAVAVYGQKHINIFLSERHFRDSEEEQRSTICHELIHAHLGPVDHLLIRILGTNEYQAYQLSMEYAVEGLAQALAPSMPLPSEVRPVEPTRPKPVRRKRAR